MDRPARRIAGSRDRGLHAGGNGDIEVRNEFRAPGDPMNFLPVVHRELLVAARDGGHRRFRTLTIVGGLGVFLLLWSASNRAMPEQISEILFLMLGAALFAYALASGPIHTSDAIGREKREGTLGLLFLTELRGYDVVLGKLVSHSIRSVYAVIGMIPVLALPMMLGGISGGQVIRMVWVVLVTMGLSMSLGMLASVLARDFRSALMATVLGMGILTVGLDGGGWVWGKFRGVNAEAIRQYSPLALFRWSRAEIAQDAQAHEAFRRGSRRLVFGSLLILGAASMTVGRYREEIVNAPVTASDEATGRKEGLVGYRQHQWSELLVRHPYAWLQRVLRPVPAFFLWGFWGLVGLGVVSYGGALWLTTETMRLAALGMNLLVLWALHLLVKVQVTMAATRGIAADRESGALELLVVAGIGGAELEASMKAGLIRQYLWAVGVVLFLHFPPLAWMALPGNNPSGDIFVGLFFGMLYGAMLLLFDLASLIPVGLRHGLKESNPSAAFRATIQRVLVPGWIGMLPILVLVAGTGSRVSHIWLHLWVFACVYGLHRVRKRARVDVNHGFREIVAGLEFDTDEWELRDDFRRAAGEQFSSEGTRA